MKTNIYHLLPAALLALAACSSETDFTQEDVRKTIEQQDVPVAFSTYIGKAGTTRAISDARDGGVTGIIGSAQSLNQHRGFGVFAYLSATSFTDGTAVSVAPNFMWNQQVADATDNATPVWAYSPVKYWPNGVDTQNTPNSPSNTATETATQYLNFFAYAPYTATAASGSGAHGITGIPSNSTTNLKFTYTMPENPQATSSVDFLWGVRGKATYKETAADNTTANTYNVGLTKQTVSETVQFNFKHALAKIGGKDGLKVVADFDGNGAGASGFGSKDANTLITVKSVTIKDALSGGTTTMLPSGQFDISTGTWSDFGTPTATSQQTLANIAAANINEDVAENFTANSGYPTATASSNVVSAWYRDGSNTIEGITTTAKSVYKSDATDAGFLLIPGSAGQTLEVEVEYVVRTYDSALDPATANDDKNSSSAAYGTWTKVTQKIKNNVTLPALEVNKYYTLVIHLGLTSVKFSAEVSDWDSAGDADTRVVWLPSNVVDATPATSATIAAGSSQTVYAAAAAGSFTINVSGCKDSETVTVAKSGAATAATAAETSSNTAVVTVTLPANASTTSTASSTITITGTKSDDSSFTTTVTIVQTKATS